MFDNPEKELKRLEEELLKSDCADEDFEHFYRDIFEEFGTEEPEEPAARPVQKRKSTYADTPRAVAPKKKKGVGGLIVLICLELLGIGAMVAWWMMRLL